MGCGPRLRCAHPREREPQPPARFSWRDPKSRQRRTVEGNGQRHSISHGRNRFDSRVLATFDAYLSGVIPQKNVFLEFLGKPAGRFSSVCRGNDFSAPNIYNYIILILVPWGASLRTGIFYLEFQKKSIFRGGTPKPEHQNLKRQQSGLESIRI